MSTVKKGQIYYSKSVDRIFLVLGKVPHNDMYRVQSASEMYHSLWTTIYHTCNIETYWELIGEI